LKLPGHRPGLPGKVISLCIVPLDPAYKAGLPGHVPAKGVWMKTEEELHVTAYRTYIFVWVGLVILTGLTYTVAVGLQAEGWAVLIALVIAGTKSGLVLNYFMHLKSERLTIFRVIIPLVMAVLLVFILLTFSDLAFRGGVK